MTTKKASKKKRKSHLDIGSDPPVLVGGGGSSYIWVNLNQGQTQVNPNTGVNPGAPTPHTPGNYNCSRITRTPPKLYFFDGTSGISLPIKDLKSWYIRVD